MKESLAFLAAFGERASALVGQTIPADRGIAGWTYAQTGIGWRLRVLASTPALDAMAAGGASDLRQRAGLGGDHHPAAEGGQGGLIEDGVVGSDHVQHHIRAVAVREVL